MKKLLLLPLVLISCFCLAQDAKKIIGKPIKIGNLLVAQNDFPIMMRWSDAKSACADLGDGWRLPTKYELNILYENKDKIGGFKNMFGGFARAFYWSSTEFDSNYAWNQDFNFGYQFGYYSRNDEFNVRAIRAL